MQDRYYGFNELYLNGILCGISDQMYFTSCILYAQLKRGLNSVGKPDTQYTAAAGAKILPTK